MNKVKRKVFIYVKERFLREDGSEGFDMESVLSTHYNYPKPKAISDEKLLEMFKEKVSKKDLIAIYDKEKANSGITNKTKILEIELVMAKNTKWYSGEYYAHEYDEYAPGRIRQRTYTNGYQEFECECLNKDLTVLDGIWEEDNGNGCGDYFDLHEIPSWHKRPKKKTKVQASSGLSSLVEQISKGGK